MEIQGVPEFDRLHAQGHLSKDPVAPITHAVDIPTIIQRCEELSVEGDVVGV